MRQLLLMAPGATQPSHLVLAGRAPLAGLLRRAALAALAGCAVLSVGCVALQPAGPKGLAPSVPGPKFETAPAPAPVPASRREAEAVPPPPEVPALPEGTVVPQLRGSSIDQAGSLLAELGFGVAERLVHEEELFERFGEDQADWPRPGTVIGQSPPPDATAPPGAVVTLDLAVWGHRASIDPGGAEEEGPDDDFEAELDGEPEPLPPRTDPPNELPPAPPPEGEPDPAGDADLDGVANAADYCPGTAFGEPVDWRGCSDSQLIERRPEGTYAFNAPKEMVVGPRASYRVVLVLEPHPSVEAEEMEDAVTKLLTTPGSRPVTDPIVVRPGRFFGHMSAELKGPPGWTIAPRAGSAGVLVVSTSEPTVWEWDVYPACLKPRLSLKCKPAQLSLAVYAHLAPLDPARHPLRLLSEEIHVRITAPRLAGDFFRNNWQWLWTGLLIPFVGWWSRKRWRGRRKRAKIKILFLAANPVDTQPLQLDEEVRAIDEAVQAARYRHRFTLLQHWAVRTSEVDDLLLRHQPHVVHFSGHGSEASELMLERGEGGGSQAAPPEVLSRLFSTLKDNVRLVVLNACYSEGQARAIGEHIDCVVGMSRSVGDAGAVRFAAGFYKALAYGRSVHTAFELAREEAGLAEPGADAAPRLQADRLDPATVFFVEREGLPVGDDEDDDEDE